MSKHTVRQDPFRFLDQPPEDLSIDEALIALRGRKMVVMFSSPGIIARLQVLAERWGWHTDGGQPDASRVVECLLLPRLEMAEQGMIGPDGDTQEHPEEATR